MKNTTFGIRLGVLALMSTLCAAIPAHAQRGAMRAAAPAATMHRVPTSTTAIRRAPENNRSNGYGSTYGYGAPFYGNSWQTSLAFLGQGQDLGIKAAIDPATQLRLAFAQRFLRNNVGIVGTGGYYLLDGGGAYAVPTDSSDTAETAPQPQVVVLQQAPPPPAEQPQPAAAEPQAPLPDEGEFTLVLQSGKQIQAAAFTQANGRIVYVTPDGTRHSVAVTDLDRDATARINEERGTPVQLHL